MAAVEKEDGTVIAIVGYHWVPLIEIFAVLPEFEDQVDYPKLLESLASTLPPSQDYCLIHSPSSTSGREGWLQAHGELFRKLGAAAPQAPITAIAVESKGEKGANEMKRSHFLVPARARPDN